MPNAIAQSTIRAAAALGVTLAGTLVPLFEPATALAQEAKALQPTDQPISFTVGDPDRRFESLSARGAFLVIHILPSSGCADCPRFVTDTLAQATSLAGVRHVFVRSLAPEGFRAFLAEFPESADLPIYRDEAGTLTIQLAVPSSETPAMIVLDPHGKEVHRWTGQSPSEHPAFAALAKKIGELTTDRETKEANLDRGLALQGYDPVAYLDESRARLGESNLESTYKGIRYRFATSEHRAAFNAEPDKYVPTYGGWCATAMAEGKKVEIDPKNFKVTNGRVFLFYNGFWGNAIKDWNKNEPVLTTRADQSWSQLTRPR